MSQVQPIPRISLVWLLIAQVLVIIPHLSHLPLWIIGLWLRRLARADFPYARALPECLG